LLAAAFWLLARFRRGGLDMTRSVVGIVSQTSVGPRERLVVVRFGSEDILLGVTPGSITRIAACPRERAEEKNP
jgi:flagellar protein FliO/FliZ